MTTRLQPGDTAPDFTLPTDTGETVTLSDLRGGRVIVYFYPTAMTPGCTTQACDFSDSLDDLKAEGYTVLGISKDTTERLAKFREKEGLTITLLSDVDKDVLTAWGAFGEKKLYGKVVEGVIRSTFVVDADGKIELRPVQRQGHRARREAAAGTSGSSRIGLFFAPGRSGGTGRHVAFRSPCLRVCGFESRLRHSRRYGAAISPDPRTMNRVGTTTR